MIRIVVTRSGGFAGIPRTTEVTDEEAVERVLALLRAHPAAGGPPRPDGFVYDFSVEGAEDADAETYSIPETSLPAEIRSLLG